MNGSAASTATASTTGDGAPTVTWQMPLDVADAVMALLARDTDAPSVVTENLPPLREAIIAGYDRLIADTVGCLDMLPGEGLLLTDGVVMDAHDDAATILLPGAHPAPEAASAALEVAATFGLAFDTSDPTLTADVSLPRFFVLHPCANPRHAAHPILAPEGGATTDAMLVTRVDIARN